MKFVSYCCGSGYEVLPNDEEDKIPKIHYICLKCNKPCEIKYIGEDMTEKKNEVRETIKKAGCPRIRPDCDMCKQEGIIDIKKCDAKTDKALSDIREHYIKLVEKCKKDELYLDYVKIYNQAMDDISAKIKGEK